MSADDKRLAIELLQKGIIQHRAGQFGLAQSHYQRAVKLDPQNPNSLHLLGVVALQMNRLPLAAKHFRACIKLGPGFAEAHNNLGVTLRRMGQHAESIAAFNGALEVREHYVEAVYNLAIGQETVGNLVDAERAYRQALQWQPNEFNAASNLGNLLRHLGRFDEALPWLELAHRLQPDSAQANGNLALMLSDLGRYGDAVRHAATATAIEPAQAQWWRALGVAERLRRNAEGAVAALRKAVALAPQNDVAQCELGLSLIEAGEIEEARTLLARVQADPSHAERIRWAAALSLPSVYRDESEVDAERARYSIELDRLAQRLQLDLPAQRLAAYNAACGAATFLLHYQDRDNTDLQMRFGDLLTRVMSAVAPQWMQPCAWRPLARGGRIRVGIVSSHLMQHSVSRYFRALLAGLDPARFDVRVWYSGERRDASTDFMATRVSAFEHLNEDALASAAKIHAAQLDVLIYPETGMDPRHQVLATLRLAPVQCVLYGHPATSGIANLDYYLSGAALEPEGAQAHYREKLVLLPGLGATPEPPPAAGDGAWIDTYARDAPLALCLQNHLKLAPAFDDVLAQIAARAGARIGFFIRSATIGQRFRARIENAFKRHGLDPATSLVFLPVHAHEAYLGGIARAAFVLDSPGFSGGATSLDAFSVGVPVLAWQGTMARGRQTLGMLATMGIEGLTATGTDDYVDKAVALLASAPRRDALRAQIHERKHVLFEHAGVIAAFEKFIEEAVAAAA